VSDYQVEKWSADFAIPPQLSVEIILHDIYATKIVSTLIVSTQVVATRNIRVEIVSTLIV